MKIQILDPIVGPNFHYKRNAIVDVSAIGKKEATIWLNSGIAKPYKETKSKEIAVEKRQEYK